VGLQVTAFQVPFFFFFTPYVRAQEELCGVKNLGGDLKKKQKQGICILFENISRQAT